MSRFSGSTDVPVLTADEMRAWDSSTIRRTGIPERVLMETAARAAASVVDRLYPHGRVAVAVGSGNNGGDALVLARTLAAWGRDVIAVQAGSRMPDEALLHGWRIPVVPAEGAAEAFGGAATIVDGLLGTGATGAPREAYALVIRAMNDSARPVVALDGPSGVDLTTGAAPGEAVRAAVTVTFGAPKRGLLLFPGRGLAGRIVAVEVGFAPREGDAARLITPAWAHQLLPAVPPDAHKGRMGRVVIVAGRAGMAGACVLAGTGALRAGAGMAVLVTPEANRVIVQSALPEALYTDRDTADAMEVQRGAAAVVAGPAMGTDDDSLAFLDAIARGSDVPLLLDADALTLLARDPGLRERMDRPLLLTPHPGEAGRLLSSSIKEITADPFAAAAALAERFRCAVLLKGTPSLVAETGRGTRVNVAGHAGLATGGNGDVLGGVIGALLARGMEPADAAAAGLYFSGRAAELAGRGRGLLPTDVADVLPDALLKVPVPGSSLNLPGILLDLPAAV
ncbi:NAD(P)H-hydrate dehydratase [Longimicrobium terrae]|uniref:Bifunctional NAD(P)H-hydrate repair enzyme n=1 Tax=Longimicrobium terrae TaxID=1639882 RepID=A0A841GU72_9BACT|nr:NAD(P)H-hydrate dehydratase [Longimicrobium terrae]MBB4635863.1 NAD(P)H-hydrate epimerase [Longimicrobium terrae]MBB6070259.1 NAD(P)H-hydrate epimerase [Longimicrobium terrae]NNC30763.1 NAD(P)H-hydrate dehydratase [Longimicrobium terrae]